VDVAAAAAKRSDIRLRRLPLNEPTLNSISASPGATAPKSKPAIRAVATNMKIAATVAVTYFIFALC